MIGVILFGFEAHWKPVIFHRHTCFKGTHKVQSVEDFFREARTTHLEQPELSSTP
jgi:hypothetical protein